MRKKSDLVSLALAAAVLAAAILLSPWATRALSPGEDARGVFAARHAPAAPRQTCNVPDSQNTARGCVVVTPEESGVLTAKAGKPF
jgi:hypothetical protein